MRKAILFALMAVGLVGCVTTTAHNVDVDNIKSLRVERVDVVLDPAVKIGWVDAQKEFAEGRVRSGDSQATEDNVAETPAFRAYVLSRLQSRTKALLEPTLRQTLNGSRPVVARMTVHHVFVPSFLRSLGTAVLVGAAQIQSGMSVSIDFVDARTNRVVVAYPRTPLVTQGRTGYASLGLTGHLAADPIDRLLAQLQDQLPQCCSRPNPRRACATDNGNARRPRYEQVTARIPPAITPAR